ncbi:HD domain-containing protein [Natrononativus amylolyticus]|uniref:HD domain-containing protein n=1 Tax=Natrononativus amylolyticus TaxID=2963434 RepID=UPI0020CD74B7|nr:HD domain-containing protein [Natrononativus amylolyticus]
MSDDLRSVARSYFDDRVSPAHDWHHVERVEALAARLAADRTDVDDRVLEAAVLLHDIGRAREDAGEIADHAEWGAREARAVLSARGVAAETIDAVCHCVRAHRYSNAVEPRSPAARILCDADNLDAIGAIGLARTFSYGGEHGIPIVSLESAPTESAGALEETTIDHVEEKLLSLRERMYTEEGRALAESRHAFVETYLERLEREVAGDA